MNNILTIDELITILNNIVWYKLPVYNTDKLQLGEVIEDKDLNKLVIFHEEEWYFLNFWLGIVFSSTWQDFWVFEWLANSDYLVINSAIDYTDWTERNFVLFSDDFMFWDRSTIFREISNKNNEDTSIITFNNSTELVNFLTIEVPKYISAINELSIEKSKEKEIIETVKLTKQDERLLKQKTDELLWLQYLLDGYTWMLTEQQLAYIIHNDFDIFFEWINNSNTNVFDGCYQKSEIYNKLKNFELYKKDRNFITDKDWNYESALDWYYGNILNSIYNIEEGSDEYYNLFNWVSIIEIDDQSEEGEKYFIHNIDKLFVIIKDGYKEYMTISKVKISDDWEDVDENDLFKWITLWIEPQEVKTIKW